MVDISLLPCRNCKFADLTNGVCTVSHMNDAALLKLDTITLGFECGNVEAK